MNIFYAAGFALVMASFALPSDGDLPPPDMPGIVSSEFIFGQVPSPQCHASTIAETPAGLVAAWFGGTREKNPDVCIWLSRHNGKQWSTPEKVADGVQADGKRHPCWNPVLFQPKDGLLLLFYKVGPSPESWWGVLRTSSDGGRTWSRPQRLPKDILGPVRNKPIALPGGHLLCGSSTENDDLWRVHFEITTDLGNTWERVGPINDGIEFGAIQPTILTHRDGRLQALCRTKQGRIADTWSTDSGHTWSALTATPLPNPNSGIDAVTLQDGRQLLVYNHISTRPGKWGGARSPLNLAVSDDGKTWKSALIIESEPDGEFSYPAVIQTHDGLVHITYTWKRHRIKHIVLNPAELTLHDLPATP